MAGMYVAFAVIIVSTLLYFIVGAAYGLNVNELAKFYAMTGCVVGAMVETGLIIWLFV